MKSLTYLSFAALTAYASAQDIDTSDYPAACQRYCAPVAARATACDSNGDDDDDDDDNDNCICNGQGMSTAIPRCDACVAPFRIPGDDDYSDIQEILQQCGLSTTSLPNAPTPTTTYVFTTTSVDDDGDTDVETITSFGAALPTGLNPVTSVYTTTSTDDDGDTEVETETTTFFSSLPASLSSTVITTTSNGETLTTTRIASPTGANAGSGGDSSSNSDNAAPAQTAAPILGAAAIMAMGAFAAL